MTWNHSKKNNFSEKKYELRKLNEKNAKLTLPIGMLFNMLLLLFNMQFN